MTLIDELKKNPFVLAPMAGITDCAYRSFIKRVGGGIVISELVSSHGINFDSQKTLDLIKFTESQNPIGIQLFGECPESVGLAAKKVEYLGADFIDLNFGCPVKKVVKKGAGSAILKDMNAVRKMFQTVKASIDIPLTVKIRTGWDEKTKNADEVCKIAFEEGLTWVAIHGRTRAQGYEGYSDWDYIAEVKSKSKIPVLGNGDIHTPKEAVLRLTQSNCDGVMIGRGALKNPWIFCQANKLLNNPKSPLSTPHPKIILEFLKEEFEKHSHPRIQGIQLRKFAGWFSAGYPGSANFRKSLYSIKNNDEIYKSSMEYFDSVQSFEKQNTSGEAFLMGGHG